MDYREKRKHDDLPPRWQVLLLGLWRYLVVLPVSGVWWLMKESAKRVWWATKANAKGAWWLTRQAAKWAWAGVVWGVKTPIWAVGKLWQLIMGLPPEFETIREQNIYRLIRRRYRRRNFFTLHTFVYLVGLMIAFFAIFDWLARVNPIPNHPFVLERGFGIVLWTLLWVFHWVRMRSGEAEDRDLHAALDREYMRQEQQSATPADYPEYLALEFSEDNTNHSAAYYEEAGGQSAKRKR